MNQGYRVFGANDVQPEPADLVASLRGQGMKVAGRFRGDDQGWFQASFTFEEVDGTLQIERFLASEEGIRDELNSWAAWLETQEGNPRAGPLMRHVIGTTQVFALKHLAEDLPEELLDSLSLDLCRYLARQTAGVYQVDGQGFFDQDGILLVRE